MGVERGPDRRAAPRSERADVGSVTSPSPSEYRVPQRMEGGIGDPTAVQVPLLPISKQMFVTFKAAWSMPGSLDAERSRCAWVAG